MKCPRCGATMQTFPIPHEVPRDAPHGARGAGVASVIFHCGGSTGCGNQFEVGPKPHDSGIDEPCGYCHRRPAVGESFATTGDGIRICKGCAA